MTVQNGSRDAYFQLHIFNCTSFETMSVVQAFLLDRTTKRIRTEKSDQGRLYLAADIESILGVCPSREVYVDLKTTAGERKQEFFMEEGVYRLLMDSNKPIAQRFQKWVANVIRTIDRCGKYDLVQELSDLGTSRKRFREYKKSQRRLRTHSVLLEK